MIRIVILASLGVIISANWIPSHVLDYPRSLQRLFGVKREVSVGEEKRERSLCETEECKLIANIIKESMNESVDPCDDFYEYACGHWSNKNPLPENETSWSLWNMVQSKVEKQTESLIKSEPKPDDLLAVKLAKKWYQSCMDEEAIERRGVEPLLSTLWRHGGWPLIMEDGEWDDRIYNWQIVDDHFARLLGFNAFHFLRYDSVTYGGNETIVILTPDLPARIRRLLPHELEYVSTDSSDENNESGEGSQEEGSNERGQNNGEDNEEDDTDQEENENEGEDEARNTKIAGRKVHKRLGFGGRKGTKAKAASKHISKQQTRKRTKRDVMEAKILRYRQRKHNKITNHRVHHGVKKTKAKSSKRGHLYLAPHTWTSLKKHNNRHVAKNENNVEKNNGEHTKKLRKRKLSGEKVHKQLGHKKSRYNKNKLTRKHDEENMKKRRKGTIMDAKVHNNKQHKQKKISHHNVHHYVKKVNAMLPKHKQTQLVTDTVEDENNNDEKEGNTNTSDSNNSDANDEENNSDTENENNDGGNNDEENNSNTENEESSNDTDNEESSDDTENEESSDDTENEESSDDTENEESSDDTENEENEENDSGNGDGNDEEEEDEEDGEEKDEEEDDDDEKEDEELLEEIREKYENYILNITLILSKGRGIEVPIEKLKEDISKMVDFAVKVAEITLNSGDDKNTTLRGFQEYYNTFNSTTSKSKVDWRRKVQKLFAEAGVEIEDDEEVTITCPSYFKKLVTLLDETPAETIVNYIHWIFVEKAIIGTTKELRDMVRHWMGPVLPDRGTECTMMVETGSIIAYEYVRKYFSDEIAQTARDMIDDIQKEVEYQIKESTWMNDDTKHFILDKLVNMKNMIGYPDWYRNTTMLKKHFQGLTVGPSYYENILNYVRHLIWRGLRRILKEEYPVDNLDPLMLNAFFTPDENSISITAVDFQSPFFSLNRPWNVNFGIIGVVMAHEVNHGFDDSGHLYDKQGNLMEWLSAMAAAYDQRADCFVHQFNNYSLLEDYMVEDYGNQTAGENIADTMGLQAVFRAYQRRQRECVNPDPALPGLEKFDNEQTFFLSFANLWCENIDEESLKEQATYDPHSTGRLRVIGSVSNSEDFAKAFNCPVGSPMNPEKKCNIWI